MEPTLKPIESAPPGKSVAVVLLLVLLFLFVIASRFAWLSEKPYHHDESQYAAFSFYNFRAHSYKFDPVLHGPFLTYFNTLIYAVIGSDTFSARFGVALLGAATALIFLFMARQTGIAVSLALILLYAISPSFTYFNRFLAHDTYVAFFSALFVFFFIEHIRTKKTSYIYAGACALSFLFLVKLNSYIYSFIFFTFLILVFLYDFSREIEEKKREYIKVLKGNLLHLAIATVVFFVIYFLFYSSFFNNIQGFFDGLFLKSIRYWAGQNAIQRIKGDFDYYVPIIATYELPALFIVCAGYVSKAFENRKLALYSLAVVSVNIGLFFLLKHYWHVNILKSSAPLDRIFDNRLHMQAPYHLPMAIFCVYLGAVSTFSHFKRGNLFGAFAAYWLSMSFLIYSYAGEKVPWLVLNILLPMIFYAAVLIVQFIKSRIFNSSRLIRYVSVAFASLFISFTIYINWRVSIKYPADPKERLVFVQTSTDIAEVVNKIETLAKKTGDGKNFKFSAQGESGWPLNWYFKDYKYAFPPPPAGDLDNKIIITDFDDSSHSFDKANFIFRRYKLREWWVPDMAKKAGFKQLLRYYFLREVWSAIGSSDITLYVRRGME